MRFCSREMARIRVIPAPVLAARAASDAPTRVTRSAEALAEGCFRAPEGAPAAVCEPVHRARSGTKSRLHGHR